jgi:hypothetical protein
VYEDTNSFGDDNRMDDNSFGDDRMDESTIKNGFSRDISMMLVTTSHPFTL